MQVRCRVVVKNRNTNLRLDKTGDIAKRCEEVRVACEVCEVCEVKACKLCNGVRCRGAWQNEDVESWEAVHGR